jgi:Fe-S cluster assembly scaffold protein SufB
MSNQKTLVKYYENINQNILKNIDFSFSQEYVFYIIANKNKKHVTLNLTQLSNTSLKITINCICLNDGKVSIKLTNSITNKNIDCKISQEINGLIINDGSIDALPILKIKNNKVNASHSINIGGINKNELFYLLTKGIDKNNATAIIIDKLFSADKKNEYRKFII